MNVFSIKNEFIKYHPEFKREATRTQRKFNFNGKPPKKSMKTSDIIEYEVAHVDQWSANRLCHRQYTLFCVLFSFNFRTHTTKIFLINLIFDVREKAVPPLPTHNLHLQVFSVVLTIWMPERHVYLKVHCAAFGDQPTIFYKLHNAPANACNVCKLHAHICERALYCNLIAHVSQFYHGNFNITFNDFVIENFFVFGEFEFHFWHTPLSIRMRVCRTKYYAKCMCIKSVIKYT